MAYIPPFSPRVSVHQKALGNGYAAPTSLKSSPLASMSHTPIFEPITGKIQGAPNLPSPTVLIIVHDLSSPSLPIANHLLQMKAVSYQGRESLKSATFFKTYFYVSIDTF